VECSFKALIAKKNGGTLPSDFFTHDLDRLRSEVVRHISDDDVLVVQSIPHWSSTLRYECAQPRAHSVVEFLNRAKEAYRCLSTYL
jgi:hypothetical protein